MPAKRLSMRKIKDVLRLCWGQGLSKRKAASSCGVSRPTVADYLRRAEAAGLSWPLPAALDDGALARLLFPPVPAVPAAARGVPDWSAVHRELKRPGVTLQLLWYEYRQTHPQGYQYTRFCQHYRTWRGKLDLVMRQGHRAGEKLFVDYAGMRAQVINPATGEVREAEVFVAVLGASNYTYAEATWTQGLEDWVGAHGRCFTYFGGVPAVVVPDNLRAGVSKAHRYEPDINPTYQDLAAHYGVAIVPARVRHPRDKAKAEVGVQVVERWILAALRQRQCFSLAELNRAIRALLETLNNRPFKKLPGTRRTLFEQLDKPALRPLPVAPYVYAEWKQARVHIDYHVEVHGHYYSVPHALIKKQVDVRITRHTIECCHRGCQCRCKTPHLCRIKIPQFVDGGRSLRLAECHTTEDAVRLVSTDGGYRGDYLGESIHASRTACTRRVHQRHCPPNGTGPQNGQTSLGRGDPTTGVQTENVARFAAGSLHGVSADPSCRVSGIIRCAAFAGDTSTGVHGRIHHPDRLPAHHPATEGGRL